MYCTQLFSFVCIQSLKCIQVFVHKAPDGQQYDYCEKLYSESSYRVRLIHFDGHFVDSIRCPVYHFEETGSTKCLGVHCSGKLKIKTQHMSVQLNYLKLHSDLKILTSSLSKNSRTSGSCSNSGWQTTLWRYLHKYSGGRMKLRMQI